MKRLPLLFALFLAMLPCAGQTGNSVPGFEPCDLLVPDLSGARPPEDADVQQVLNEIVEKIGLDKSTFGIWQSGNSNLALYGAVARVCNTNQRYIFYDPHFLEGIKSEAGKSWAKHFVLAHELAHHQNMDQLQPGHVSTELKADHAAATWMVIYYAADVHDLVNSIESFVFNQFPSQGWPSKCERIAEVINGYNDAVVNLRVHGIDKPLYDVVNCAAVPRDGGFYAARSLAAGERLAADSVKKRGEPAQNKDVPSDFKHDLAGMCTVGGVHEGDRLTWNNIGVCALMARR